MKNLKKFFGQTCGLLLGLAAWCGTTETWASDVTLRLLDQNGALIPMSQFEVLTPPGGTVENGGTISLPDGTHTIRLLPGLNGVSQTVNLYRDETVTISGSTQTVDFVWVTASLQVNLVDQNNVPIPASQFQISFATNVIPDGSSTVLPVTDDPNTTPIGGTYGDGYAITLYPGLNGNLQNGQRLIRNEKVELTTGGTAKIYLWVTAPLQVNIVDQNNVTILASQFLIAAAPNVIPDGSSVVLPVTDDPNTTPIGGTYGGGYAVTLYPGLNGVLQPGQRLIRNENVELTATNFVHNFAWEISKGTLHVVDFSENEVNGASIRHGVFLGTVNTGTCISLPITDNWVYPTIGGQYASGYDFYIQTVPANPFEGPFTFRFLSNKVIDPAFVTLASGQHGLRFDLMTPTVLAAHAGSDQTINLGQSVQIGGSPTATGGSGSYTISWSPSDGLDDASAANPMASPASTTTYTVTVTDDATGCQATDEITVQVNQVKPFVFLADKITLKRDKQRTPAGDIHSNGAITIEKGDPSIYNSNLTAVGNIVIQKSNTVNGNVKSATAITNQGTINGTPSIAPVNSEPLPSKSFSAGGANKTVAQNGSLSLSPGSYGIVTLNSFSTLKLTSGDYYLNELRYASTVTSAVIEIDLSSRNPVTINVVSNLQLGNEVEIRLLPNGETDSKLVTFFTLQNSALKLGREAYLLGSFNAPNALATLVKNSQLRGAICAKELLVERDCLFLHHNSSGSLPGPGNLPKSLDEDEEEVIDSHSSLVIDYQLAQNYPNPFNPSTKISFALPEASEVELQIFNEAGQLVRTLTSGRFASGRHELHWDARNQSGKQVAAGVYLYRLTARGENGEAVFSETKRMTLVK